jgi:hypothetical protein
MDFFSAIINPSTGTLTNLKEDTHNWGKEIEEEEEFTGNEGATRSLTYEKYMLAFWPKNNEFQTVLNMSCQAAIKLLSEMSSKDEKFSTNLKSVLERTKGLHTDENHLEVKHKIALMKMIIKVNDYKLAKTFIKLTLEGRICFRSYGSNNENITESKQLAKLIIKFGWQRLKGCFQTVLDNRRIGYCLLDSMCSLVQDIFNLHEKQTVLECFETLLLPIFEMDRLSTRAQKDKEQHLRNRREDCLLTTDFHALIETLILLSHQDKLEMIKRVIQKDFNHETFKCLLLKFDEKKDFFKSAQSIKDLYDCRIGM